MLQVIKSHSSGTCVILFQCCFMIEMQLSMTVSNFFGFFLGIISWKWASLFNEWGLVCFSEGGSSFLSGGVGGGGGCPKDGDQF